MTEADGSSAPQGPPFRIGHGFDIHRLESRVGVPRAGRLVIGGIHFPHATGAVGHSDADALLHAITDALLGAIGEPDIGQLFPNTDPKHKAQDSEVFLTEACSRVAEQGWTVGNLDATVILQQPKIGARKTEIVENIARILGIEQARVNVKGKTHEHVDAAGRGRAIIAHAVVLLCRA